MTQGIEVPITTPGGAQAEATLRGISGALAGVGVAAKATSAAFSFNEVRTAITSVYGDVTSLARAVADLASEQARLDANSARLGLDFNQAADAAGRFTDETEAMTAATRLAEAGIRLNQQQLDGLTRVAARFAQNTGVTTREAIDTLTNGLITGSERGLRPFGGALAAAGGEAHTATDRLAALTAQAVHTEQATDDAASAMERFGDTIDDAKRTMATAFTQGIADTLALASAADTAGNRFEILDTDIASAGRSIGTIVVAAGNGIALVVGGIATGIASMLSATVAGAAAAGAVIDRLRSGHLSGLGAAAASAFSSSYDESPITQALARFTSQRAEAAEAIFDRGLGGDETSARAAPASSAALQSTAARARGGGREEERKSAKLAQMAAEENERERLLAQMRADRALAAEIVRTETERERLARESADAYGEQVTHANELARIQARIAGLQQSSVADAEVRLARARMAQQRAEGAIGQRAELEDIRDPAAQRERIDEMRRAHTLDRERAYLTRRYEMQRGFVERMEELNDREVNGNEALATSITDAFKTTGDALADHLQKFADGRETAAEAAQNMLADTLKNIGKESLVKAGFYFAEGLGNLATFNFPGAATAFAASAAFAAVGGGLIAGGNELTDTNTLGARKDAAAKSESRASGESAARVSGSRGGTGGGAGAVYNINFGGPMYGTGGVRRAAREIVGVVNRGGIQGGVQILPGALLGGGAGS